MVDQLDVHIGVTAVLQQLLLLSVEDHQKDILLAHDVELYALFDDALAPLDQGDPLGLIIFYFLKANCLPDTSLLAHY